MHGHLRCHSCEGQMNELGTIPSCWQAPKMLKMPKALHAVDNLSAALAIIKTGAIGRLAPLCYAPFATLTVTATVTTTTKSTTTVTVTVTLAWYSCHCKHPVVQVCMPVCDAQEAINHNRLLCGTLFVVHSNGLTENMHMLPHIKGGSRGDFSITNVHAMAQEPPLCRLCSQQTGAAKWCQATCGPWFTIAKAAGSANVKPQNDVVQFLQRLGYPQNAVPLATFGFASMKQLCVINAYGL